MKKSKDENQNPEGERDNPIVEQLQEEKKEIETVIEEKKEEIAATPDPVVKQELKEEVKQLTEEKKEVQQELKVVKEETKTPDKKKSDMDTLIWILVIVILLVVGYSIYKYFKNVETETIPENNGQ